MAGHIFHKYLNFPLQMTIRTISHISAVRIQESR